MQKHTRDLSRQQCKRKEQRYLLCAIMLDGEIQVHCRVFMGGPRFFLARMNDLAAKFFISS